MGIIWSIKPAMAMATADGASGELPAAMTMQRWEGFRARRQVTCKKISVSRAARRRHFELTQKEKTAHRNVPVDMLAMEWLSEQRATVDTRAYLVDGLLPTLVLGVEKLLTEVSSRCKITTAVASYHSAPIARYRLCKVHCALYLCNSNHATQQVRGRDSVQTNCGRSHLFL